jgi:hypothetical protein
LPWAELPIQNGMKHIVSNVSDVPLAPPLVERRKNPDRRAVWRGGRRDSDWVNRPRMAWANLLEKQEQDRMGAFRRAVFSVLHLW